MNDIINRLSHLTENIHEMAAGDQFAEIFAELPEIIEESKKTPLDLQINSRKSTLLSLKRDSKELKINFLLPDRLNLLFRPFLFVLNLLDADSKPRSNDVNKILRNLRPLIKDFSDICREENFVVGIYSEEDAIFLCGEGVRPNMTGDYGPSYINIPKINNLLNKLFR